MDFWKHAQDVWTDVNTQNDYNAELIIKVGFINRYNQHH